MIETAKAFVSQNRKPGPEFHQTVMAKHFDLPLMGGDNGLGNGQPQTVVLVLTVSGRIQPVEPFKNLLMLVFRYLSPGIDDRKHGVTVILRQSQAHIRAALTVTDGIVQQNGGQLLQLVAVSVHGDFCRNIGMQHQSLFKGNAFEGECFSGNQTAQIDMLHPECRVFGSGKLQKLPHQKSHPFVFVLDILKPLVSRISPLLETATV